MVKGNFATKTVRAFSTNENLSLATLGGGCFWCTEAVYNRINGVQSVISGFSGGHLQDPSYRDVCRGKSGHAEVVQISFDNKLVSFEDILKVHFATHDPTTLNQQGNDFGEHYRSVVLYHNET